MEYEYDIFLSYNRKHPHGEWVNEIFFPLFVPYVEDSLNRKITVFKDDREINSGADWEQRILRALLKSRTMVSILSPAYFMSEWCTKEFKIMHYRQMQLGFLSMENPEGIIVPLRINDGDYFPACVKKIQALDCRSFFRIGDGFRSTAKYVELQDKLIKWSEEVAGAINNAPKWSNEWTTQDWIGKSYIEVNLTTDIHLKQPKI